MNKVVIHSTANNNGIDIIYSLQLLYAIFQK